MDQLFNAGKKFLESQNQGGQQQQGSFGQDQQNFGGNQDNYGGNQGGYGGGSDNQGYGGEGRQQHHEGSGGGEFGVQGGAHLNRPQGQSQGSGGLDFGSILSMAQQHGGGGQSNGGGNNEMFGMATKFLQSRLNNGQVSGDDFDENRVMQQHAQVNDSNSSAHANDVGGAAAVDALKSMFGSGGGQQQQQQQGGGDMQSKLIAMAMAQAGKMFEQKQSEGNVSGGNKQDAMNSAGEMVMKMMMKQQMAGMMGGGNSGGLGQLAKMFM
ncbi:hypothetical protein FA09DRAFT_362996 [Tilletiopsis washingtonensis]|uniref:DUF7721 domain-containing protein n=1 Tax=Tilletiopsis washingtonensis TaxID=58919 RepID=A0A316Z380_9BASI|nr:hypothetical protein FA09DRAFT_362996 [Tilletiopsis washingtonensis]PWN95362.1 hypothetical protein FA09DRAFT_362996 [Tilletiopsis washingtonensis]